MTTDDVLENSESCGHQFHDAHVWMAPASKGTF